MSHLRASLKYVIFSAGIAVQMTRFIKIGEAAKILGVSIQTLRRWKEYILLMKANRAAFLELE